MLQYLALEPDPNPGPNPDPIPSQVLQAFRRQQDGNDGLQMRPAGTSAAPSTMQNVTPEVDSQLPPARAVLGVGVGVAKP